MPQAFHGGAFYNEIGSGLEHIERSSEVISADVLDAWFDPAPEVISLLRENLPFLTRTSPPIHAEGLRAALAKSAGIAESSILVSSGSSSLMFSCLPRLLGERPRILLPDPTYGEYEHICENLLGGIVIRHKLDAASQFVLNPLELADSAKTRKATAVALVNPNNPTGRLVSRDAVLAVRDALPENVPLLVDETYIDYADPEQSVIPDASIRPGLVVLKSLSKVLALSGLRVAYMVAEPRTAAHLALWIPPWAVSLPAQAAALEALRQPGYYEARYGETRRLREEMIARLQALSSDANFYLIQVAEATRLAASLRQEAIFVREFPAGPLAGQYLRIAVKDAASQARILEAIQRASTGSAHHC